jgi:hypothetical protein
VSDNPSALPSFVKSANFPFEGQLRVKRLDPPVGIEPARDSEDPATCVACGTADDAYIWVSDRWRVRAMDRPGGLPMVLILESRSHLDLGDLPNLLAAELGVMTVRLERAIRSLDGVASVHMNRWADGPAHLHLWFLARPTGYLQLRGTFLSMWDDILERVDEAHWREDLALVAAWLGEFGGRVLAEPPRIEWHAPSSFNEAPSAPPAGDASDTPASHIAMADSPESAKQPVIPGQRPPTADTMPSAAPEEIGGDRTAADLSAVGQPATATGTTPQATVVQPAGSVPATAAQSAGGGPGSRSEHGTAPAVSGQGGQEPAGAVVAAATQTGGAGTPQQGAANAGTRDGSLAFLTELSGGDENYDFATDAHAPAV